MGVYPEGSAQDWKQQYDISTSQRVSTLTPAKYDDGSMPVQSLNFAVESICRRIQIKQLKPELMKQTMQRAVSLHRSKRSEIRRRMHSSFSISAPEERSEPTTMVMPTDDGHLMISMVNNTYSMVTYEVVGDTERRMLEVSETGQVFVS